MAVERVIFEGYPDWRLYFPHALGIVLAAALFGSASGSSSGGLLAVSAFAVLSALRFRRKYTATDYRIVIRTGLLARNTEEVPTRYVSAIRVRQGFLDRILGIGTIEFTSMADSAHAIRFEGVPAPHELKESLGIAIRT